MLLVEATGLNNGQRAVAAIASPKHRLEVEISGQRRRVSQIILDELVEERVPDAQVLAEIEDRILLEDHDDGSFIIDGEPGRVLDQPAGPYSGTAATCLIDRFFERLDFV